MRLIIVPGSKNWTDEDYIRKILTQLSLNPEKATLVVSNSATSADLICKDFAIENGWDVEIHDIDWSRGRYAEYYTGEDMVESGGDICLAFVRDQNEATDDVVNLARLHSIQTYIINHPKV